jgi:hypothetical protein
MEENLKPLMHALGEAINDSLKESDKIAEAIGELKRAGYDIFLILEATIGFSKSQKLLESPKTDSQTDQNQGKAPDPKNMRFTTKDHRFLEELKVADPDDERGKK